MRKNKKNVAEFIEMEAEDKAINQLFNSKAIDRIYKRCDRYQLAFYNAMQEYKMVFVDAPAGTGKTTIAVMAGLEFVRLGKGKLIYMRFPSKRGERLGAVPGELKEKEYKYMLPFYEALNECGLQDEAVDKLIELQMIEARTDVTERGRNYKNCFVIIDEAQNAEDIEQLRLVLTRLHDNSIAVIIGHSEQTDSKVKLYGNGLNAFQIYTQHMIKMPWAIKCELNKNYRGVVAQWADRISITLNELESR